MNPRGRPPTPATTRFWRFVSGGAFDECWLWQGAKYQNGYGAFTDARHRSVKAHRFAYEDMVAPIPEGLQVDHLCHAPACVNPWHLEPVDALTNTRRRRPFRARNAYSLPHTPDVSRVGNTAA